MPRVLITGSTDGLGLLAGQLLAADGHAVTLHARTEARAGDARSALPAAEGVLIGDLSTIAGIRAVAAQAEDAGRFDAVVHNAAVGYQERSRVETGDGLALVFAVNVLAPYLLTALMTPPDRLVYLSSGMHRSGDPALDDLNWARRRWNGSQAYADSKLWDAVLSAAVARRRPDVLANSVDPGWVATRMGGPGASDDLAQGPVTQAWLAVSADAEARTTGGHWYHRARRTTSPAVTDVAVQEGLLAACAELTGVPLL